MTLNPIDDARRLNSPPLQGRGKGWGLSAEYLALLHKRASDLRKNPTEPEKRVWGILSGSQLNGHKFRRQAVIPPFIADFLCPQQRLIVEVDGDTHDEAKDRLRDDALAARGYRVVRVTNFDVMSNLDGVAFAIGNALAGANGPADRPHPNPSPEGEGLLAIDAYECDIADMERITNAPNQ